VIMVGSAGGEMLMPLVLGSLLESVGPWVFPVCLVGACALGSVAFVGMLAMIRSETHARYEPVACDGVMA
jgi:hypothetical protein